MCVCVSVYTDSHLHSLYIRIIFLICIRSSSFLGNVTFCCTRLLLVLLLLISSTKIEPRLKCVGLSEQLFDIWLRCLMYACTFYLAESVQLKSLVATPETLYANLSCNLMLNFWPESHLLTFQRIFCRGVDVDVMTALYFYYQLLWTVCENKTYLGLYPAKFNHNFKVIWAALLV